MSFRDIYEKIDVYGTESKLKASGDRYSKTIEELRKIKDPKKILDIGCGDGFFTNELMNIFPKTKVYGTDISRQAINKAQKKYKKIVFKLGNSEEKLPFPEDYFDLIICGEIIEHLVDIDHFLIEIRRVLSKKGLLILTTPNLVSWLNRVLVLSGKWPFYMEPSLIKTIPLFRVSGKSFPEEKSPPAGHLRLFTISSLQQILSNCHFKMIKVVGISYLSNSIVKTIDRFLTFIPTMSTGLLLIAEKVSN